MSGGGGAPPINTATSPLANTALPITAAGAAAGSGGGATGIRLRIRVCKNIGSRKLTLLSVARTGSGTPNEWATFRTKASALLEIDV